MSHRQDGKGTWRVCLGLMMLSTWRRGGAGKTFLSSPLIKGLWENCCQSKEIQIHVHLVLKQIYTQAGDPSAFQEVPDG